MAHCRLPKECPNDSPAIHEFTCDGESNRTSVKAVIRPTFGPIMERRIKTAISREQLPNRFHASIDQRNRASLRAG